MLSRIRRLLKWPVYVVLALILLFASNDALHLNPAEEAASPYTFDLLQWEATNFLDKWIHRLTRSVPWNTQSSEEKREQIERFFALGEELSTLQEELTRASARSDPDGAARVDDLHARVKDVESRRNRLRNDVEETIEATISAVISDQGLGLWGELIFPPVDIRLSAPPKVLVTSPRDRIRRTHDVLLRPGIGAEQSDALENKLLQESDLAALVLRIGGLATYPASLPNNQPLRWTLQISAHEWLHHFFFFRSVGQNMFRSGNMQVLNETMADIAGREIGDMAFVMLGGVIDRSPPVSVGAGLDEADFAGAGDGEFDFDFEMRTTRLKVDRLLGEGMIEEAEAFMEERRKLFVENGFFIRKLNQAFFAFNGTYAESAASVSPIGDQLHRFRDLVPDVGAFVGEMSGISSYQEFLDKLEQLEAGAKIP